jgi:pSer/pThr/pTyr-binding forkhead associated (FHA) protein
MAQVGESAMLILQQGAGTGRRWPLDQQGTLTIGRGEDCDVILRDRHVSRYHARISWVDGRYSVEDLDSKNGTHVNGRELTAPQVLEDGDEIQIALRFKLAFVDAGATAPLTFPEAEEVGLRLDEATRQVYMEGRLLEPPLSPAQYRLLKLLAEGDGSIVNREVVVRTVWSEVLEEGVSEQAIDALVRRLRERLAELDSEHQYVVTVRGHGFRFANKGAL